MTNPERHTLARVIDADPQRAADEMIQLRALLAETITFIERQNEMFARRRGPEFDWCSVCLARVPIGEKLVHTPECPHSLIDRLKAATEVAQ